MSLHRRALMWQTRHPRLRPGRLPDGRLHLPQRAKSPAGGPSPRLGSVLTTLHRRRKARIHEILGIHDHIETAAIIPLGWPNRDYGPNRRPPLAQFVMYDRWTG